MNTTTGPMDDMGRDRLYLWQEFSVAYRFPVRFTRNVLDPVNPALAEVLASAGTPASVFPIADDGVVAAHRHLPENLQSYAARHSGAFRLAAPLHVMPGGETCKDGPGRVQELHSLFLKHALCRHSVVLAVGGGAFLDVVGFAASTAHRGIRIVRLPTTTLAQNDAGVGVKNGYNAFGRKNWVGTFVPPFAVINDFEFLKTLPERYCRSGMAEAVKVAVIKDSDFFRFLSSNRELLSSRSPEQLEELIVRSALIHLRHIATGDPFEQGSARPLDFGHWMAHAIEDASCGQVLHGEAVAIGMALDCRYAREAGLLSAWGEEGINSLLRDLGFVLNHPTVAAIDPAEALERFRQHLGGRLAITLPTGIGRSVEVDSIGMEPLRRSLDWLMSQTGG